MGDFAAGITGVDCHTVQRHDPLDLFREDEVEEYDEDSEEDKFN